MKRSGPSDADDLFADTRMSFGDHIEDLRKHLWRAIVGFFVAMVLCFSFSSYVLQFIKAPVEKALGEFQERKAEKERIIAKNDPDAANNQPMDAVFEVRRGDLAQLLVGVLEQSAESGKPAPNKDTQAIAKQLAANLAWIFPLPKPGEERPDDWVRLQLRQRPSDSVQPLVQRGGLITTKPTEGMMVWLQVSLICGLVLGSPWIFYQLWSFVGAGLYANEKRLVHFYMPFSLALFLAGVFLCELIVIPKAVRFLLEFNEWIGVGAEWRLEDWLSFALMLPLVFGISFQTPLIMLFLAKIGIFDAAAFRAKRKIAWFSLIVIAALAMPTTDPYAILMMQVPLIGLYEFGILLAAYVGKKQAKEEVPDPEEMVGV